MRTENSGGARDIRIGARRALSPAMERPHQWEPERDLMQLCLEKGLFHIRAGDLAGAIQEYGQVIGIGERLVNEEGRRELADGLAEAYMNQATMMRALGDAQGSVAPYGGVLVIMEQLVEEQGRSDLASRARSPVVVSGGQGCPHNPGLPWTIDQPGRRQNRPG